MSRPAAKTEMATIDWSLVKTRLRNADREGMRRGDLEAIFARRAEALAQAPRTYMHNTVATHLACDVATMHFLIPLSHVTRIMRPRWVTRLPGAPRALARIMQVDGRIISIVDLSDIFGAAGADAPDAGPDQVVVLLGDGQDRLGLAVHAVRDTTTVDETSLSPQPGAAGTGSEFVRGLGPQLELVLDASRLLHGLRARPTPKASASKGRTS